VVVGDEVGFKLSFVDEARVKKMRRDEKTRPTWYYRFVR